MAKKVGPRLREPAPAERGNHGRGITQPRTSLFNIPVQKPGLFSGASSKGFRVSCHEERTGDQGNWAKEASLDFIPTIEVNTHMMAYHSLFRPVVKMGLTTFFQEFLPLFLFVGTPACGTRPVGLGCRILLYRLLLYVSMSVCVLIVFSFNSVNQAVCLA